jgi:hypothetical protein
MTATKAKKTSKKPAAKTTPPSELEKIQVSLVGMGAICGISAGNVSGLTASGTLAKNADGNYNLVEQVRAYIRALRERSRGGDKSTLETEALALKNEKAKTFLENWRRDRDRQIAGAIVEALRGALLAFKENVQRGMAVNAAIDAVLDSLESVDLEIVLEPLEQDEEEDEN